MTTVLSLKEHADGCIDTIDAAAQNSRLVWISHHGFGLWIAEAGSILSRSFSACLLASGLRTMSCWLRAADVSDDWQDRYCFLQTPGRRAKRIATKLLHLVAGQIVIVRFKTAQRQMKCAAQNPGNYSVKTNCVRIRTSTILEASMKTRSEPRMDANGRE